MEFLIFTFLMWVVLTVACIYVMNQSQETGSCYVVTAHRWGDSETHNYIYGVFSTIAKAEKAAEECEEGRGVKYECRISYVEIDKGGGHTEKLKRIWDDYPENHLSKFEERRMK